MNLAEMMDTVRRGWRFLRERYPELPETAEEQQVFAVRHILYHILKPTTGMFRQLERYDHSPTLNNLDKNEARIIVFKLFRNVLRLASVLEITADELEQSVQDWKPQR